MFCFKMHVWVFKIKKKACFCPGSVFSYGVDHQMHLLPVWPFCYISEPFWPMNQRVCPPLLWINCTSLLHL